MKTTNELATKTDRQDAINAHHKAAALVETLTLARNLAGQLMAYELEERLRAALREAYVHLRAAGGALL